MANNLNVSAWSITPADNDDADSAINWAEGQDPATVNNSARGMMAATKRWANTINGHVTVGGTGNAITISTWQNISTAHQDDGFRVCFKATATNTGTVTASVDGLSAAAVKRLNGDALSPGDIVTGGIYDIVFDGTNYQLLGTSPVTTAGETFELVSTDAGASAGPHLTLYRNSATPADNDLLGTIVWSGEDSAGNQQTYAADYVQINDVTSGTEDAIRVFQVTTAGTPSNELVLSGAGLYPNVNDGLSLGIDGLGYADLFLASGGNINWNSANVRIVHLTNALAFEGVTSGVSFDGHIAVTATNISSFSRNGADVAGNTTMRVQRSDAVNATGYELIDFVSASTQVGSITLTTLAGTGNVAYNTTSDGRRKPVEHRRPIDDSGAIIDALNPIRFRWEDSDEDRIGFIAQEVVEVLPSSIIRGDDDPNKRPGDEGYQGWEMAVGSMEALLVAEIKALRARVAALEAK